MGLFYIAVLFVIAWLTSDQIDFNNWENLRKYYSKLIEEKNDN